jgi:hypothetical protein
MIATIMRTALAAHLLGDKFHAQPLPFPAIGLTGWNSTMRAPLSADRIRTTCRPVTRRPAIFVLIALALLLAPLGICLNGSPAMAASANASAMHHKAQTPTAHHGRDGHGKLHYCPECQPPSFVKAGKVAAPDVIPLSAALGPVAVVQPLPFVPAKLTWARGLSTRLPPVRRTYRIRLQI